jgi:glycosyltransferase involved in cell wall biosynthesis
MLGAYVAPISFSREQAVAPQILPRRLRRRVETELRRRMVPDEVMSVSVRREATLSELLVVGAQRLGVQGPLASALLNARNTRFDQGVARLLGEHWSGFVGAQGACLKSLRTAKKLGIPTFLHSPIAHHRHARRILGEEVILQPDFAGTMQHHNFSPSMERQLDDEIALAETILVLSSYQARTFIEEGVARERLALTPLGVDLELFKPPTIRTEPDRLQILFVGQLTQRKGLSYLLDGFGRAGIPGSELILVGQPVGNALDLVRKTPGARHVAHMPRWLLPAIYSAADIFVLPSLVEGFGLTALEAMACGLPVIVSENTFARDVVTDGADGYIVPVRDSAAIVERLRQLAEYPTLRRKMGDAAASRAKDFSWEHYGRRVADSIGRATDSSWPGVAS